MNGDYDKRVGEAQGWDCFGVLCAKMDSTDLLATIGYLREENGRLHAKQSSQYGRGRTRKQPSNDYGERQVQRETARKAAKLTTGLT